MDNCISFVCGILYIENEQSTVVILTERRQKKESILYSSMYKKEKRVHK